MRFSCGYTTETRNKRKKEKFKKLGEWHPYFLWIPKTIGERDGKSQCFWLCYVECRLHWYINGHGVPRYLYWDYRLIGQNI